MARILLAGLFHETHTFVEGSLSLADFAVRHGDELFSSRGDGSPLAGFLEIADEQGWEVLPAIDLRATPGPICEDEVLDAFWTGIRETVEREASRGLDAIFLVLHGAMVCRSFPDPEGEIIARIRALPSCADLPMCGVLDLHGNISAETIERTDGLIAYRTNPHEDAHATTVDAARLLQRILSDGQRPTCLFAQPGIVWPPTGLGTADDPMRTLERMAREIERDVPEIAAVNVMGGYSFADTPDTGISFAAITFGDPAVARDKLRSLVDWSHAHREDGLRKDASLADVFPKVHEHIARGETPVLLVEPAENIGGGAPGDGTSILRALLRERIVGSGVIIADAAAIAAFDGCPVGTKKTLAIGGRGSRLGEGPLELAVELVSTSDGRFDLEDRHSHLASIGGVHIEMGPCAVVHADGVTILLTSRKTPPWDLGQWRSQGIDPEQLTVIGVKAAVAHRKGYDPITRASYTVDTPGPCSSDVTSFPFDEIRRPVFPLDR